MIGEVVDLQRAEGLTAAAMSDCGRVRERNEDAYLLSVENGVFLVVDGVGGAAGGEIAARIARDAIRRRLERTDEVVEVRIREAITIANRQILLRATEEPELAGMACVLTLAVLEGRQLTIGHVGDSRLYKLDADGITKLTHDHSPIGELEDAREITEDEAMCDQRRNEVYRDVGSEPRHPDDEGFIEIVGVTFDDQSAVLLCSDGLSDLVGALAINRIVREHAGAPDEAVTALVAAANDLGGKDNITVVLVEAPKFWKAKDGGRSFPPRATARPQVPTVPLIPAEAAPAAPSAEAPALLRASRWMRSLVIGVIQSRGFWFAVGSAVPLVLAFGVVRLPETAAVGLQRPALMLVGGSTAPSFGTISEALAQARPGDVVQVPPGQYSEQLEIPAGVELRGQGAERVALVAQVGARDWTAITMRGDGAVVRGIRIVGTPEAPIARAISVAGSDVVVDDVTIGGDVAVGIELFGPTAQLQGSRFERVAGTALRIAHGGALVRQNIFRTAGPAAGPAIQLVGGVTATVDGNLFIHFQRVTEPGSFREQLAGRNYFEAPAGAGR